MSWGRSSVSSLGLASTRSFDRSPILTSWMRQSLDWPLSSTTTTTKTRTVLPFQCDDDRFPFLIRPRTPDTGNYSQRRSMNTSLANTHKAPNANLSEKRRRKRLNGNERRKRNTRRKLMRSSWRPLKVRETMDGRRDSSGAPRNLGVGSMHTTVPKGLRVVHQGSVDLSCVPVAILKPHHRCLRPLRPNGQRANAPWTPS
jgi:hypothetical protein